MFHGVIQKITVAQLFFLRHGVDTDRQTDMHTERRVEGTDIALATQKYMVLKHSSSNSNKRRTRSQRKHWTHDSRQHTSLCNFSLQKLVVLKLYDRTISSVLQTQNYL